MYCENSVAISTSKPIGICASRHGAAAERWAGRKGAHVTIGTSAAPAGDANCPCLDLGPRHPDAAHERDLGIDETEGRFADVELVRCLRCRRLWLHYHVEYGAFTASGRWASTPIGEAEAGEITPERAADFIAAAPWHIYGGSWFGHAGKRGHGRVHWGL